MSQPKVSLVFPCWHAAQHMQHVLEDLQAQTFKDFEAILVNDGDDGQVEAMEAIAAQDSRIRIVNLPQNSGVAAARNAGTDAVTSEWVTYPDPDDRFGANYVKSLYEAVDGTDVEMACGGFSKHIVENCGILHQYINTNGDPKIMDIASGYELMLHPGVFSYVWNKLYSIGIIHNNNLLQERHFQIAQDYAFNMMFFTFCKKVGLVSNCDYVYYYYQNGSNSNRFHPFFFQYKLEIIDLRENFHRIIGWPESRISEVRQEEISKESFQYVKRFYAFNSQFSIRDIAKEIKKNYLSQPNIVNAVKKTDPGKDYIKRIFRFLTKLGSSYTMAITFRIMFAVRHRFTSLYARKRNLLRGNL
jgi:glycosyltransferase involved in cell wall biosynthesis